jgi:hypothetical protein
MKIKVDFKKLVWGAYYPFNFGLELEMINWLFKTGLEGGGYQEQHGWFRSGINQLLYGYSFNDEIHHYSPFPIHNNDYLHCFINAIFTRAFLAPYSLNGFPNKIALWREKNKIDIGKYRFFTLPEPSPNNPNGIIWEISNYHGKELKRHLFHQEFTGRSHPRIISITFSTYGEKYFVSIEFSFWEFNYEPGWTYSVAIQEDGEYIGDFLRRAERELDRITINTDICKRLQFNQKNHFVNFHDKNCSNCTWLNEENKKVPICHLMEFDNIKKNVIENKYNHLCDKWSVKDYSHFKEKPSGD